MPDFVGKLGPSRTTEGLAYIRPPSGGLGGLGVPSSDFSPENLWVADDFRAMSSRADAEAFGDFSQPESLPPISHRFRDVNFHLSFSLKRSE